MAGSRPKVCFRCNAGDHARCHREVLVIAGRRTPADLGLTPVRCGCECQAAQLGLGIELSEPSRRRDPAF